MTERLNLSELINKMLPWWCSGKESACKCRKHRDTGQSLSWEDPLDKEIKTHSSILAEKAMATHSSTLAWKIPWAEEPGGLQSMGLLRVRHD